MRPFSKAALVITEASSPEPTSMPCIMHRPLTDMRSGSVAAIAFSRRPSSSARRFTSLAKSSVFQKCRMAAVAVTKARSEEHTSELQSLMRISYAVFCLKKKTETIYHNKHVQPQLHIVLERQPQYNT